MGKGGIDIHNKDLTILDKCNICLTHCIIHILTASQVKCQYIYGYTDETQLKLNPKVLFFTRCDLWIDTHSQLLHKLIDCHDSISYQYQILPFLECRTDF